MDEIKDEFIEVLKLSIERYGFVQCSMVMDKATGGITFLLNGNAAGTDFVQMFTLWHRIHDLAKQDEYIGEHQTGVFDNSVITVFTVKKVTFEE